MEQGGGTESPRTLSLCTRAPPSPPHCLGVTRLAHEGQSSRPGASGWRLAVSSSVAEPQGRRGRWQGELPALQPLVMQRLPALPPGCRLSD